MRLQSMSSRKGESKSTWTNTRSSELRLDFLILNWKRRTKVRESKELLWFCNLFHFLPLLDFAAALWTRASKINKRISVCWRVLISESNASPLLEPPLPRMKTSFTSSSFVVCQAMMHGDGWTSQTKGSNHLSYQILESSRKSNKNRSSKCSASDGIKLNYGVEWAPSHIVPNGFFIHSKGGRKHPSNKRSENAFYVFLLFDIVDEKSAHHALFNERSPMWKLETTRNWICDRKNLKQPPSGASALPWRKVLSCHYQLMKLYFRGFHLRSKLESAYRSGNSAPLHSNLVIRPVFRRLISDRSSIENSNLKDICCVF